MAKGSAVSVYLDDGTLALLDNEVARKAAVDRAQGLSGYQVTNRSKLVSRIVQEFFRSQGTQELTVRDIKEAVVPLAKEYGARQVSLFGSFARGEQTEESDVDILLDKGSIKGMQVLDFKDDLARLLGRPVDVVTTQGLGERFAARIKKDEVVLYAS